MSAEFQHIKPAKPVSWHKSFIKFGETVALEKCESSLCTCLWQFHCPFCDVEHFSSDSSVTVQKHLERSHWPSGVQYKDLFIVRCRLSCGGDPDGHYHCPCCYDLTDDRHQLVTHLQAHLADQGESQRLAYAPDVNQPEYMVYEDFTLTLCKEQCHNRLTNVQHYHCPGCGYIGSGRPKMVSHMKGCEQLTVQKPTTLFGQFRQEILNDPREAFKNYWHESIVRDKLDIPIERCKGMWCCSKQFHCPLCTQKKTVPDALCNIRKHFSHHLDNAVIHKGYIFLSCLLDCVTAKELPPKKHYHCPYCGKGVSARLAFMAHLKPCSERPERPERPEQWQDGEKEPVWVGQDSSWHAWDNDDDNGSVVKAVHRKQHVEMFDSVFATVSIPFLKVFNFDSAEAARKMFTEVAGATSVEICSSPGTDPRYSTFGVKGSLDSVLKAESCLYNKFREVEERDNVVLKTSVACQETAKDFQSVCSVAVQTMKDPPVLPQMPGHHVHKVITIQRPADHEYSRGVRRVFKLPKNAGGQPSLVKTRSQRKLTKASKGRHSGAEQTGSARKLILKGSQPSSVNSSSKVLFPNPSEAGKGKKSNQSDTSQIPTPTPAEKVILVKFTPEGSLAYLPMPTKKSDINAEQAKLSAPKGTDCNEGVSVPLGITPSSDGRGTKRSSGLALNDADGRAESAKRRFVPIQTTSTAIHKDAPSNYITDNAKAIKQEAQEISAEENVTFPSGIVDTVTLRLGNVYKNIFTNVPPTASSSVSTTGMSREGGEVSENRNSDGKLTEHLSQRKSESSKPCSMNKSPQETPIKITSIKSEITGDNSNENVLEELSSEDKRGTESGKPEQRKIPKIKFQLAFEPWPGTPIPICTKVSGSNTSGQPISGTAREKTLPDHPTTDTTGVTPTAECIGYCETESKNGKIWQDVKNPDARLSQKAIHEDGDVTLDKAGEKGVGPPLPEHLDNKDKTSSETNLDINEPVKQSASGQHYPKINATSAATVDDTPTEKLSKLSVPKKIVPTETPRITKDHNQSLRKLSVSDKHNLKEIAPSTAIVLDTPTEKLLKQILPKKIVPTETPRITKDHNQSLRKLSVSDKHNLKEIAPSTAIVLDTPTEKLLKQILHKKIVPTQTIRITTDHNPSLGKQCVSDQRNLKEIAPSMATVVDAPTEKLLKQILPKKIVPPQTTRITTDHNPSLRKQFVSDQHNLKEIAPSTATVVDTPTEKLAEQSAPKKTIPMQIFRITTDPNRSLLRKPNANNPPQKGKSPPAVLKSEPALQLNEFLEKQSCYVPSVQPVGSIGLVVHRNGIPTVESMHAFTPPDLYQTERETTVKSSVGEVTESTSSQSTAGTRSQWWKDSDPVLNEVETLKAERNVDAIEVASDGQRLNMKKDLLCIICRQLFGKPALLTAHVMASHFKFRCRFCLSIFTDKGFYAQHLKACGGFPKDANSYGPSFRCGDCWKCYPTRASLDKHQHKQHGADIRCSICSKTFPTPTSLCIHLTKDHGQQRWKCELCDKSFTVKSYLIKHQRSHGTERTFLCPTCGKLFKTSDSLRDHAYTHKHKPENKYTYICSYCDQGFTSKHIFRHHVTTHTGERAYASKIVMKPSSDIQTPTAATVNKKPFVCRICSRVFERMTGLRSHMVTHTGVSKYRCTYCQRSFGTSGTLKRHVEKCKEKHPGTDITTEDGNAVKETAITAIKTEHL